MKVKYEPPEILFWKIDSVDIISTSGSPGESTSPIDPGDHDIGDWDTTM